MVEPISSRNSSPIEGCGAVLRLSSRYSLLVTFGRAGGCHRIAQCHSRSGPSRRNLRDIGYEFDGAPDLEFRAATKALELDKSGLSYQRVPPGYRFPYGHTHVTQEEVYMVLRESRQMKVDDEIVELKKWDAVRVPPGTWRGYEAEPEGLEILVIGAPNLGGDPTRASWPAPLVG